MNDYKEVFVETIYFVKLRDMFVKSYERGSSFALTFDESEAKMFEHQTTKDVNDNGEEVVYVANSDAEDLAREVASEISEIFGGNADIRVGKKVVTSSTDIKYIDDIDAVEPDEPDEPDEEEIAPIDKEMNDI